MNSTLIWVSGVIAIFLLQTGIDMIPGPFLDALSGLWVGFLTWVVAAVIILKFPLLFLVWLRAMHPNNK